MSREGGLSTGTPGKLVTLESIILKKKKGFFLIPIIKNGSFMRAQTCS